NGIGVGEGAFVFLTGLFGITSEQAVPVALVLLGVSTLMSLIGGLLLLERMLLGVHGAAVTEVAAGLQPAVHPAGCKPAATAETPAILKLPAATPQHGGVKRHAA